MAKYPSKYWVQLSINIDCLAPGNNKYNAMQVALAALEAGELDDLLNQKDVKLKDNPAVNVSVQGLRLAMKHDDNDIKKFHIGGV